MGSGKTTQALKDLAGHERVIIFSPGSTNPLMHQFPYIWDTPIYLKDWHLWLLKEPRLRVEKRAAPTAMFRLLSHVRGYSILLDDVAALKTLPEERADFEAFLRTVRFNGNQVVITTHRARKDLPPLLHTIGTSFYYVGPGPISKREVESLRDLVNYPVSDDAFAEGLKNNPPRNGGHPAGIFPIRRAQ